MLWPCSLKAFAKQLNVLNMDGAGFTPMENFSGTTTDITIKNQHTRCFPVYVLDSIFQGNIVVLPKWEPRSLAGIYLGPSQFHA